MCICSGARAKSARCRQAQAAAAAASASGSACASPACLGDGDVNPGYVKSKLTTTVPWAQHRFVTPRSRNMSVESQTSFAPSFAQSPEAAPQFILADVTVVSSPVDVAGGLAVAEVNALSPPLSNLRLTAPAPPNAPHVSLADYASIAPAMYFQHAALLAPTTSSQGSVPAVCASYTGGMAAVPFSVANMYNSAPQAFASSSVGASYPVPLPESFDPLLVEQSVAAEGYNNLNSGGNFVQQMPTLAPAASAPAAAPANVGVAGLEELNELINGYYPNEAPLPLLQPANNGASLSNQMFVSPHYAPQRSVDAYPFTTSNTSPYMHG